MDELDDLQTCHKTLNINHTHNANIYKEHFKHNNYTSVFSCSLKEKLPGTQHTQSDLSISRTNLNISLPYPIFEPFHCDAEKDPCLEIVQEKTNFKRRLESYRRLYAKEKKKPTLTAITSEKKQPLKLPQYLVDLSLNGDKNPYFDGKYDWFYTGGNLDVVEIEDDSFLISVQGNNVFATHLESYTKQQLAIKSTSLPIYNISSYHIDNHSYLTLRTKHCIQVVKMGFKNEGTLDISTSLVYEQCTDEKSSPPFIDAVLFNANKLISANVEYEVHIHDIEATKLSHKRTFELSSTNRGELCQLEAVSNCLLFMARDSLSLLDFRMSSSDSEKCKAMKTGFFQCDDLCAICVSSLNDNFVYIASRHNVFKCDLREMEVVKKWAHLLDNSPIKIKTMRGHKDGDEYVYVASFDETICIHVSRYTNHMPFKLRDITTAYNKLRFGDEFILREDIEKRFKLSTAGLATHDFCVFTANSIGDVYKQEIVDNSVASEYELHVLRKLKAYIAGWPYKPRQLQVTHFKEMSDMREVLLRKPAKKAEAQCLKEYSAPNRRLKKFLNPNVKFGNYDMAMIWQSERVGPLDDSGNEVQQKERISTWLAQSTVEDFDSLESDKEFT